MSSKSFPQFDVEIPRGRDVITVSVPEHEVRVLQAIHPVVTVIGKSEDEAVLDGGAETEFQRLSRKYVRINAPDPVRAAYPMGPQQLEEFGFSRGGAVAQAAGAQFKKHKPEAKPADSEGEAKSDAKAAKAK